MNKREFVAGSLAAVVAAPTQARSSAGDAERTTLTGLLSRTHRLPDLVEHPGADAFEAYVGERFAVVAGVGTGEQWVVASVERVARCLATEQFTVSFASAVSGGAPPAADGIRVLMHATGQRLALYLERGLAGYAARFNLLA